MASENVGAGLDPLAPPAHPHALPPASAPQPPPVPVMEVQELLRMTRDETVRNAMALDMISTPRDAQPSSSVQQPISKHVLETLFNHLMSKKPGNHVYVENEENDHFLYGLVLPLLARILAVSCPGLLCIVVLSRPNAKLDESSKSALRLICNGFEVLTGRMPIPKNGSGDFTLATTGWIQAGVISPRKKEGVVMTFSNGMMARAEGVVVTFSNGSMCQLTLQEPEELLRSLHLPEHIPVVLFTLSNPSDSAAPVAPATQKDPSSATQERPGLHGGSDSHPLANQLKNAIIVEIGHKGSDRPSNKATSKEQRQAPQDDNKANEPDPQVKASSASTTKKRVRTPTPPPQNHNHPPVPPQRAGSVNGEEPMASVGVSYPSQYPSHNGNGQIGRSQSGGAGMQGPPVAVIPNAMPLFVNSSPVDGGPVTRLPDPINMQPGYMGIPAGPGSQLPSGGVPTYGIAPMPPHGHGPPVGASHQFHPYAYMPMSHQAGAPQHPAVHPQYAMMNHDREGQQMAGESTAQAMEALVHMRGGYPASHGAYGAHATQPQLRPDAGYPPANNMAHQPTNGYASGDARPDMPSVVSRALGDRDKGSGSSGTEPQHDAAVRRPAA